MSFRAGQRSSLRTGTLGRRVRTADIHWVDARRRASVVAGPGRRPVVSGRDASRPRLARLLGVHHRRRRGRRLVDLAGHVLRGRPLDRNGDPRGRSRPAGVSRVRRRRRRSRRSADPHRRPRRAHRSAARGGGVGDSTQLRRARERLRRRGALRHGVRPRLGAARPRRPSPAGVGAEGRVGVGARGAARARRGGAARGRRARRRGCEAGRIEAVDDDPAARHRRGPGQLGRPHRHDHPRGRPARHGPGRRLRRAPQPRAGAARAEGDAVQGADQRALRTLGRRRDRRPQPEAGRLGSARDPGRLLRARQPRRLRRPRRRARRRRDPRQGAAARRGDAGRVGRAEAADRRRAGRAAPLLRPRGARVRPLAEGLERLHADGSPALLPQRDGRPARPGPGDPELRLAGEDDRDERPHRHPTESVAVARAARRARSIRTRR